MSSTHITHSAKIALTLALIVSLLGMFFYLVLEPMVGRAATDDFTVTQTITDEISFTASTSAVSMSGSISGLTGGTATGNTYAVVQTNDPDGYQMTIVFSSTTGMVGNSTGKGLAAYASTSAADFTWVNSPSGGSAQFGYSAEASTTEDTAQAFKDNGAACGGAGSLAGDTNCWMGASTTAQVVTYRTSGAAAGGATTTLRFKVYVPNAPSPSIPADTYVATATLTATNL